MAYTRCGIALPKTHTASQITVAKTPLASFESNVSGLYIPEILAYIQATQAGTGDPSPINPRAINGVSEVTTAFTGKNLANVFVDGKVPSTSTGALVNAGGSRTDFIKCFPSEQYTLSCSNSQALYVFYYDENKGFLNYSSLTGTALTVTTPLNAKYLMLRFGLTTVNNGMLEKGETATTFEPFGTTATTDLGGTYYGGYVNVQTGLMTVTHGIFDLGDYSYTKQALSNNRNAFYFNYRTQELPSSPLVKETEALNNLCSIAKETYQTASSWGADTFLFTYSAGTLPAFSFAIIVSNSYCDDATTFASLVAGQKLAYALATPIEIQLTPAQIEQLLGENNVFCSTGDVAVKYWKID